MKSTNPVSLTLALLLISAVAGAQNKSTTDKPDPLSFVKIAAAVAGNVQQHSLDGYLGIYVSEQNWAEGLKDGDLGPFLKIKDAKPGRSAACLFSADKASAICVYFDGTSAFGVDAVQAPAGGSIQSKDIEAAYKQVTRDMLKKGDQQWQFAEGAVNTDSGVAIPGFQITK